MPNDHWVSILSFGQRLSHQGRLRKDQEISLEHRIPYRVAEAAPIRDGPAISSCGAVAWTPPDSVDRLSMRHWLAAPSGVLADLCKLVRPL